MDPYLWLTISSVFIAGLLSGVHCAGMCGGIVGVVSMQVAGQRPAWHYQLVYNFGRIFSYIIAGVIVGAIGQGGLALKSAAPLQEILFALASSMMIIMGLYLAGLGQGVRYLEKAGSVIWKFIQPYTRRLLPVDSLSKALWLGTAWGWLPCGLVYTMLIATPAQGGPAAGALYMALFGLGTLPAMLAVGLLAGRLHAWSRNRKVQVAAGLSVIVLGLFTLVFQGYNGPPF